MRDLDRAAGRRLDAGFEAFVTTSAPTLLRAAFLLTRDRADAEDLLQSALLRTSRRWGAIQGDPVAYAFAVLANLARDRIRDQHRRPITHLEGELPDRVGADELESVLDRYTITQAARRLPAAQREVLACRFLLDLSVSETARALRLPEGTVKSYTARGLARIRELLEDDRGAAGGAPRKAGHAD